VTIEELKRRYKEAKALAEAERARLEEMRSAFAAQCSTVESLEAEVRRLKESLTGELLAQEGLS